MSENIAQDPDPTGLLLEASATFLAVVLSIALYCELQPSRAFGASALAMDVGARLTLVDELSSGRTLYQEVAWLYGPITAYPALLVTRLLGNSLRVAIAIDATVLGLAGSLLYSSQRLATGRMGAILVTGLVLVPTLTRGIGTITTPWVWLWLALLAAIWRPPHARSDARSLMAGLALAALQMTKFGTHVAGAAAWLVLDSFAAHRGGRSVLALTRSAAAMLSGYVLGLMPWVTQLLLSTDLAVAYDVLWPRWTLEAYAHHTERLWTYGDFLTQMGWGYVLGVEVPQWACLSIALAVVVAGARGVTFLRVPANGQGVLIPPLFVLALVCLGLIRHPFHYIFSMMFVYPAAALLCNIRNGLMRTVGLLLLVPVPIGLASSLVAAPDPDLKPVELAGEKLWISPVDAAEVAGLRDLVRRCDVQELSVVGDVHPYPGLYHYLGVRPPSRHFWFSKQAVRPYEQEEVLQEVARGALLIAHDRAGSSKASESEILRASGIEDPDALLQLFDGPRVAAGSLVLLWPGGKGHPADCMEALDALGG